MCVLFRVFCVLFVCNYVLYYCHQVSTQLQLNICHIVAGNSELFSVGSQEYDSVVTVL
jgi:hypothetical protein